MTQDDLFSWSGRAKSKLQRAFEAFHAQHPDIYPLMVAHARAMRADGARHSTIAYCFEAIRGLIRLDDDHCGVKLNNNHRAYYARKIMENEPDLEGFFRLRKQKIQCTFGPDNDELEDGGHRS